MEDDIETSFQAAIDNGKINGAVICATDAEGKFVYEKALGKRTLLSGEKLPQQLDDVLFLASATKLLTTIATLYKKIAPLQEGHLRPVEEAYGFPLAFHPGEGWMYGGGLDWAGRIVERVTGRTLGEHMQQRIFDPFGINSAQFYPVTREDLRARLDYVKILRSVLANDGKVLKPASVNDMFEHHLSHEATAGHKAVLASPMGAFFSMGVEPSTKVSHGLGGLLTLEDVDGWYGERTMTWGGGLTLTWFIDRKNGLCGVGAVQGTIRLDGKVAAELKQTFRHDIYRKHASWKSEQR
ncbi:hypothetical protein VE02_10320, partial [Pseudogymnoascus sp. 03VT05]